MELRLNFNNLNYEGHCKFLKMISFKDLQVVSECLFKMTSYVAPFLFFEETLRHQHFITTDEM